MSIVARSLFFVESFPRLLFVLVVAFNTGCELLTSPSRGEASGARSDGTVQRRESHSEVRRPGAAPSPARLHLLGELHPGVLVQVRTRRDTTAWLAKIQRSEYRYMCHFLEGAGLPYDIRTCSKSFRFRSVGVVWG